MTRENKWILYFVGFVLVGGVSQYLFVQSADGRLLAAGFSLFLLALFLFSRLTSASPLDHTPQPPPRKVEVFLFGLAGITALFFGLFRLDEEPPGLFIDLGALGMESLRFLKDHQFPPLLLNFLHTPPLPVYGLAAWFIFFPASVFFLHLFFLILAWLGLSFAFRFFQRLGGKTWAWTALVMLSFMRWYFATARDGHASIQSPLFIFLVLLCWIKALQGGKLVDYFLTGLFLGAGFYSYQSLKVLPLLVGALFLYETFRNRSNIRWKGIALMGFFFLALSMPVLFSWIQQGSLGVRESELWIGKEILSQKSIMPLLKNLADWTLMFNHLSVPYRGASSQGHRILDDVTSFLFWIGFFRALFHWKDRPHFYLLSGFFIMSLPQWLASDYLDIPRIVGAAPFMAGLAALPVVALLQGVGEKWGKPPKLLWVSLVLALVFAVFQNFDVYFRQQASDRESWRSFGPEATFVGEAILHHPGVVYDLDPYFAGHESTKFICCGQASRVSPLNLQQTLRPSSLPDKSLCFTLDRGKKPTLLLIEQAYPGGKEEDLQDPWGSPLAYFYYWNPGPQPIHLLEERGLLGKYFTSGDGSGSPIAMRWDPLLNFTNLGDFPIPGPLLTAQWEGILRAPQKGRYGFLVLAKDHGRLWIDGRSVVDTQNSTQGYLQLSQGEHRIQLCDERAKPGEIRADFHFLWRIPGAMEFRMIPMMAYGMVKKY